MSLESFMQSVKKGSRKFRKILMNEEQTEIPHNINKFAANTADIVTVLECFYSSFTTTP